MSTLNVDSLKTLSGNGIDAQIVSIGGGGLSNRNKARNGAMKISQRGTTFSSTTSTVHLMDGWRTDHGSSGNLDATITQSTDAPAGFSKSLKITPDSTLTPSGSQNGLLAHYFEGQDFQDLAYGTSDAKPITVSWYAKTSASGAGNYTVKVDYRDASNNTYSVNKLFAFTTTWTRYTYTIPATGTSTTNGIRDTSTLGLKVEYHLFAGPDDVHSQFTQWAVNASPTFKVISGQKNFMDNTSNELYITGFQVEVGDTATSFEHRSVGDEVRRCERYFQCMKGPSLTTTGDNEALYGIAFAYTGSRTLWSFQFKTEMRANPTVAMSNLDYLQGLGVSGGWNAAQSFVNTNKFSKFGGRVDLNWSGSPFTAGHAVEMRITSDGLLSFSAEIG